VETAAAAERKETEEKKKKGKKGKKKGSKGRRGRENGKRIISYDVIVAGTDIGLFIIII
jgi:hypothetical protein